MPVPTYRVLYIEDNPVDIRFFQEIAKELKDIRIDLSTASTLNQSLEMLNQGGCDLVISDLGLPDSMGLYTVKRIISDFPELPVIVMTSINDEELGVQAIKMGAQDYLPKGNFDSGLLARAIKYSVERNSYIYRMFSSRGKKFEMLMKNLDQAVAYFDASMVVRDCNQAFSRLFGLDKCTGASLDKFSGPGLKKMMSKALSGEKILIDAGVEPAQGKQGAFSLIPVKDAQGKVQGVIFMSRDKSDKGPVIDMDL